MPVAVKRTAIKQLNGKKAARINNKQVMVNSIIWRLALGSWLKAALQVIFPLTADCATRVKNKVPAVIPANVRRSHIAIARAGVGISQPGAVPAGVAVESLEAIRLGTPTG
jgi:hypothetical protein